MVPVCAAVSFLPALFTYDIVHGDACITQLVGLEVYQLTILQLNGHRLVGALHQESDRDS